MNLVRFDPPRDLTDFSSDCSRLFVRTFGQSGAARPRTITIETGVAA